MAVSMYSVTSQQDPSPATSGSDYLKRPLHHDLQPEVESDFEPAVKMKCSGGAGGGGGRRKQSKPIRVRSDVEPAPVEDLMVDMKMPVNNSPSVRANSPTATDAREPVSYEVDDHKPDSANLFPTKYHQLGSELKQEVGLGSYEQGSSDDGMGSQGVKCAAERSDAAGETGTDVDDLKRSPGRYFDRHETDFKLDAKPFNQFSDHFYKSSQGAQFHDQSPTSSKPDCLPTNLSVRSMKLESPGLNSDVYSVQASGRSLLSDVDMSRAEMQEAERFWDGSDGAAGLEKSRIFHPDAYCDICDREFCNKYFLKTHRANKHGIYDGSSGDPAGNSNSGSLPPVSGSAMVFPQPGLGATEPPGVPLEAERATPNSMSGSSATSLPGVLPIPQLPPSFGVLPFDDAPLPPPPPPPQHQPPSRGSDMEDYCDICQKHFCNKYYLRKHRQDVHGLSPADVSSRRAQADAAAADPPHFPLRVSSSTASSSLPAPPPPALSNFPMFLPPPFGAPLPVVSPFLPGAAGLPFGSLQFGADVASSKLSTSSTSSSASQQQQQLPGAGSSLLPGMLSADAYMDLFRKELLGGYLMNNGDRDMTAAFAAVAAAAAAASGAADPTSAIPAPRLPPMPSGADPSAPATPIKLETGANPTPDTFAEMLQRIGARIGKKNDGLGGLQHDLFRLNGLGLGPRLPGSLTSTASSSSSTSSSRLVDRVVCDLCNKEVCNKYFLKTHKMKVHGWDPNTSTVMTMSSAASNPPSITAESGLSKSMSSSTQPQLPLIYHPPITDSQLDKPALPFPLPESSRVTPKDAELQQLGIDPEAYCEICRKEFCSKYFLRTHRQNIHGIHDTSRPSSPGTGHQTVASGAPLFSSAGPFSSVVLAPPVLPQPPPACLPSTLPVTVPSTSSVSSSMFLFGAAAAGAAGLGTNESSSGSSDGHMVEQRSWKWKEPVNATRVSCTLCNKVLCNKYFLRTHMAKRHGVTVDTRLLPPQAPLLPAGPLVRNLTHPPSSHPPTNGVTHQLAADSGAVDGVEQKNSTVDGAGMDPGKTGAVNLVLTGSRSSSDVQTVTARTWHVPADETTSTPHNDLAASQQTPDSNSVSAATPVKQLLDETVKCALCAAAMPDREVLLHHLTSIHHVDEQMSASLVAAAAQSGLQDASVSPGSSSSDGFLPHHPSQLQPRTPTGVTGAAGTVRRRRQFRCAYCRERFRTRVHCELHARAAHPRATGSCVEVTPAVETIDVAAPSSPPPPPSTSLPAPVFGTPLDADDASRAQLLPFILRESVSDGCEPRFSTALVYLPTFRRLTSPTNVSFSLTPVLQP